MDTVHKGRIWEDLACRWLEQNGFSEICRNYRCPIGEIDIICFKDGVIHVVEVKHVPASWDVSDIAYKVDRSKQMRIKRTFSIYLENNPDTKYHEVSFDVAAIIGQEIHFWEGAF